MAYASLAHCLKDLEDNGDLRRIDIEVDPRLEIAAIARRAFQKKSPALLFTNVRGTPFPLVTNLFGTKERMRFIFRHELPALEELFNKMGDIQALLRHPVKNCKSLLSLIPHLLHARPRWIAEKQAWVLKEEARLCDLPRFVSWPLDGGPFITLPLVYSEDPLSPDWRNSNLGMYRIQLAGNDYEDDEVGLHYQIHRGIGIHHAHALQKGMDLPVHIYVGGPPCLTLAAIMPLPHGISELMMAGLLGGQGVSLTKSDHSPLPFFADADFCLQGKITSITKQEGPFGDHVGYYSLSHPFPTVRVERVFHRPHAIWPCTSVGRPPQEDTIFGDFIHELTKPLLPKLFHGVSAVHAVDASGVHPLLLAMGEERYTAYEAHRKPREILTEAMHLLGTSQTSLAKYLLISAREDAPALSLRDVPAFFVHMLERTNFSRDLHFLTQTTCDTLDYTGIRLHEGSKLIWASAGDALRSLGRELHDLSLPEGFGDARIVSQGILAVSAPAHTLPRGECDPSMEALADSFASFAWREHFPLVVAVDDAGFVAEDFSNFLWVAFTRSDPATDVYGCHATIKAKHWACDAPLLIDARKKRHHPPELEEDLDTIVKIEGLARKGGPLEGVF